MNDCPLPPGSRVIGYLRVSGEVQKEKGTIAGQLEELQRYTEKHHLNLVHPPFVDEAKPGSSTAPRNGFQQMIAFAHREPRPCDGIIFWSWARFARDQDDAHFFKADLRRRGYILISISDGIPQDPDLDYIMEALVHWKDEQYLRQLSVNVKRGLYLLARQGYAAGGRPPRGYKPEHIEVEIGGKKRRVARWVPDPQWAPMVRKAWEMRAAGANFIEILDATGLYPTRTSLADHFRRKTYLGYRVYGDLEIPNAHEPLITPELWEAVQDTLYERPAEGTPWPAREHPRSRSSPHLLSGLLKCAYCGANVNGRTKTEGRHKNYRMYLCATKNNLGYDKCPNTSLSARRLEGAILDVMMGRVLTPEFIRALLEEANAALARDDTAAQTAALESRVRALDRAIGNLLDLAEKAGGTEEILSRLRQRQEEKDKLLRQVQLVKAREPIQVTESLLSSILAEMRNPLENGTLQAQQTMLRNIVDRIEVEPRTAYLYYYVPSGVLWNVSPALHRHTTDR